MNGNGVARANGSSRTNGHYAGPPPPEEKPPVLKDRVEQFGEMELKDVVKQIMPKKPDSKINKVVEKLEELDFDCVDDLQFLAENLKSPQAFTEWLEERAKLPGLTCMRIGQFFFE